MKYLMSLEMRDGHGTIDPDADADADADTANLSDPATDPTPTIEELIGAEPVRSTGNPDRWLGLAIALATAVIGFGFMGRALGPVPPGAAAVPSASEPTARPASAPETPAPSPIRTGRAATETVADGAILAYVATVQPGGGVELLIDGHAPSTCDYALIEVWTASGERVASTEVPVATDDERPGSDGKARVGAGRFHQRIALPGPVPEVGWQVTVTLRVGPSGLAASRPGRLPAHRP